MCCCFCDSLTNVNVNGCVDVLVSSRVYACVCMCVCVRVVFFMCFEQFNWAVALMNCVLASIWHCAWLSLKPRTLQNVCDIYSISGQDPKKLSQCGEEKKNTKIYRLEMELVTVIIK